MFTFFLLTVQWNSIHGKKCLDSNSKIQVNDFSEIFMLMLGQKQTRYDTPKSCDNFLIGLVHETNIRGVICTQSS